MAVINPPERKLAKRTYVQYLDSSDLTFTTCHSSARHGYAIIGAPITLPKLVCNCKAPIKFPKWAFFFSEPTNHYGHGRHKTLNKFPWTFID